MGLPSQGAIPAPTGESSDTRLPLELVNRIQLNASAAVQTAEDLWPQRAEASRDVRGYLDWHREVCPGGDFHVHTGEVLRLQAESIEGLSHALISALDDFHRAQTEAAPEPSGLQLPEDPERFRIKSIGVFFQQPRRYVV